MMRIVLWLALLLFAQRTWHQWQGFRKQARAYEAVERDRLLDADRLESQASEAEGVALIAARRGEKIRLAADERRLEGRLRPDEDDGGSWAAASQELTQAAARYRAQAATARKEAAEPARMKDYYRMRWW